MFPLLRLLRSALLLSCLMLGLFRCALLRRLLLGLLALLHLGGPLLFRLLTLRLTLLLHLLAALLRLLLLCRALLRALLLGLLALGITLLSHLLAALLRGALLRLLLLRCALLRTLLFGLLALGVTLLSHLLAALLGGALLNLLLLCRPLLRTLLLGLLALGIALLTHLLPALRVGLLLRHPLLGALLFGLLAHLLGTLVATLRLHDMLTPGLVAKRCLLLQPFLHGALLIGGSALALGIGLRALGITHLLGRRLLLLALLRGALLFGRRTLRLFGLTNIAAIIRPIKLWRAAWLAAALPRREAFGRALTGDPFGHQLAALVGCIALAIGLPVGHALASLAPVGARRCDHRATCRPLRRRHAAPLALPRGDAQGPCAGIIAGCGLGLALRLDRVEISALAVIDAGDPPVAIAVTVIGIAHEIRVVGARLVIIIAIAVIDGLGIGEVIAARLPDPGLDAVIVEGIIGRRIADRVADPVGPVDPGIPIVIRRLGITERPHPWQRGRGRRIAYGRGRACGQRLDFGQRRQCGGHLGVRAGVDACLSILLPAGGEDKGECGGAGKAQRNACLSGHGECSSGG